MDTKQSIMDLIELTLSKCLECTKQGADGLFYFIDPNDQREISAHYGASHAATAFLIYGKTYDRTVYNVGINLLKSILERWKDSKQLPAFHYDFNNFALCIAYDYVDKPELKKLIQEIVCNTPDSNHDTVNWLPMRWYVNEKRFEWTSNFRYRKQCDVCRAKIELVTNKDGAIEDRIPKGVSFNLQYDVSTVATLELLHSNGIVQDLAEQLGFLLNAVLPDGDINYQGRGCNQIFAWGPWIYLLACAGRNEELANAVNYLANGKLGIMLKNDNMMLNEYPGKSKYLWWDYHYASVYTAHLLLWLVLADRDKNKCIITPKFPAGSDSGFHVLKNKDVTLSWFEGRDEYLAEKGPAITALYTTKYGMIYKGFFGPWQGLFGCKYTYQDVVLKNFMGLLGTTLNKDYAKSRILRRIIKGEKESVKFEPLFFPIKVEYAHDRIELKWRSDRPVNVIFNAPICSQDVKMHLTVDGNDMELYCVGKINNQYGSRYLFQSHAAMASFWALTIYIS